MGREVDGAVRGGKTGMMEELPAFVFGISGVGIVLLRYPNMQALGFKEDPRSLSAGTQSRLTVRKESLRTMIMILRT